MMGQKRSQLRSRYWIRIITDRVMNMHVKCFCNLFVSESLKKRKNRIIKELMVQKFRPSVYIITLSQGEQNHLEFFSALLLQQHIFENEDLFVVGIANGYEDAIDLVEQIVQQVIAQTGGTDIRRYIVEQQKEFEESRV